MPQKLLVIIFYTSIYACNSRHQTIIDKEPVFSKNMEALEKIIALDIFKPDSVAFVYKRVGNTDNANNIPGPSDYYLEAALFYNDSILTLLKQTTLAKDAKQLQSGGEKKYQFTWLNTNPISKTDNQKNIIEYPSSKFYKGYLPYGTYIITGNVVLLKMFTM
jgi:hypothetical protein